MNKKDEYTSIFWKNILSGESSCFLYKDKNLNYEQFIDKIFQFPYN